MPTTILMASARSSIQLLTRKQTDVSGQTTLKSAR
jgi:hypothetical protein